MLKVGQYLCIWEGMNLLIFYFLKDFIYLFLERRKEREGNIDMWEKHWSVASCTHPTQACALTGDRTGYLSVHWATPARALSWCFKTSRRTTLDQNQSIHLSFLPFLSPSFSKREKMLIFTSVSLFFILKVNFSPWLVWLSGLSVIPQANRKVTSSIRGQGTCLGCGWGCARGNCLMFLWHITVSLPLFVPPSPSL